MSENADRLIKMLDISLEDLPLDQKIGKIRKLMSEMQDLLQHQGFREGLMNVIAKHFEKQATLEAIDIVLELIQKSESDDEKTKYMEILQKIIIGSPILENKENRIKLTAKLKNIFPKQGEKPLVDIIIELAKKAEDIAEINQHAETLKVIIRGSRKEQDLVDQLDLKREELPKWKLSIMIKGIISNKNRILLEAAKGFLETIKELDKLKQIKINICEILNKIHESLGHRYGSSGLYDYWYYYSEEYSMAARDRIISIFRQSLQGAIKNIINRKDIGQVIGSQLSIIIDLSKNPSQLQRYLKDMEIKFNIPEIASIDDINAILKFERKLVSVDYRRIYLIKQDYLKSCEYTVRIIPFELPIPALIFDTQDIIGDINFIDGLPDIERGFLVFISSLITANNDAVRRRILHEMLKSKYNLFLEWALWVIGNVYLGTNDEEFKKMLLGLKINSDVIKYVVWALALLCAGSNDFDAIEYVADKLQRIDDHFGILKFAYSLIIKHPLDKELKEKLKTMLSKYVDSDPKYFLELVYAMFRGSKDFDIARWVREVISTRIVDNKFLNKVILSIIS